MSKYAPLVFQDEEFLYRCQTCQEYWPVTLEFWRPEYGTKACRTCQMERKLRNPRSDASLAAKRLRDRERFQRQRNDPEYKARAKAARQRYYERNREAILDRRRAMYAASLDRPVVAHMGRPRVAW